MHSPLWPGTLIPDLLQRTPQARRVLDRYGLRGCGGLLGPPESLEYFARAHNVPLDDLLAEIEAEIRQPQPAANETGYRQEPVDAIYRRFFTAGIAVILTLGAVWGAYLLLRIAANRSFTSVGLHEVNAHGHAQIFGWVGLFVMGFAYQAFPRFKHTTLAHPYLAFASFWMMLGGLIVRSTLQALAAGNAWLVAIAITASAIEVAAIVLFLIVVAGTLRRSVQPLMTYDAYILSAGAWFLLQAVYETAYYAATALTADRETLLRLVATYQASLREMQIHGFAMLMILGVSQRLLHNIFGLPRPDLRGSAALLIALNLGIVGEVLGLILMRTAGRAWVVLWYLSTLLVFACVVAWTVKLRVFGSAEERDRSLKFLRAAYGWLLASLTMMVLLPAYQLVLLTAWAPASEAAQIGFSHAYYGAARHAITVGFISLMIVGVAAKVVPTLNGMDTRTLSALWLPFVLINTGCALRVSMQTLTDFSTVFFPLTGISGVLEVTGLAIWGVHLLRTMASRIAVHTPDTSSHTVIPVPGAAVEVTGSTNVGELLDQFPHLVEVFAARGFVHLRNPILRKTVARHVSLAQACRHVGVDLDRFVNEINATLGNTVHRVDSGQDWRGRVTHGETSTV